MSNFLIKSSYVNHYRMISKHSYADSGNQDELLEDLKNYRNSRLKKTTPFKYKTPTTKTHRLCTTDDFRPVTAEYPGSTANRERKRVFKNIKAAEIPKFSFGNKSVLNSSKTSAELRLFLDNFQFLTPLKLDIELNAEVVNEKKITTEKSLGIYFLLFDRMNHKQSNISNTDDVNKLMKEYCGIFRDILRSLIEKNIDEEAINLEVLWRLILKIIDSSLLLQEKTVNDIIDSTTKEIKEITEKCDKSLLEQKKGLEAMNLSLKFQIADHTKTIKYLKKENYNMDKQLKLKEAYISDLIEPESQDLSCQEMRSTLNKLSMYITESENEQIKQVNTLRDLSSIMAVAEEINKRPDASSTNSQTDWTIMPIPLPQLNVPLLSTHVFTIFYQFPIKKFPESIHSELLQICENCLNSSDGSLEYYQEVLHMLMQNHNTKEKLAGITIELVDILNNADTNSKKLYKWLLRLNENSSFLLEQSAIQLNKYLIGINEGGKYINLAKLLEFLQNYVDDDRKIFENVLEKIEYFNWNNLEDRFSCLIFRVYIAYQKNKSIDLAQEKINQNEFREQLKDQIGWIVSENDFNFFLQNINNGVDLNTVFSSVPGKVASLKIEKNAFVLAFLEEMLAKIQKTEQEYNSIWQEENINK